jgi:hypothetical protein
MSLIVPTGGRGTRWQTPAQAGLGAQGRDYETEIQNDSQHWDKWPVKIRHYDQEKINRQGP